MALFVRFLVFTLFAVALVQLPSVSASKGSSKYPFIKGYKGNNTCPGRYCGRTEAGGECGACPRGYAPDASSMCLRCNSSPSFYDWLYLGFMALVPLVLHWTFIDLFCRPKRCLCLFDLSAFIEIVLSALLTVVLSDPAGEMSVRSCLVEQFSDWYTLFFNPTPDYYDTVYCTQEIVFPLYTMILIYYTFCLVFMMVLRPLLSYILGDCQGSKAIYSALYFLPILILVHSVLGGIIYYAFPYIIVVVSVITSACHLAMEEEQKIPELLKHSLTNARSLTILLGHWLLHAYGMISITGMSHPSFHAPLLALVPFPTIFYILTVKFTDPSLVYPFKTSSLQGV
ncbi:hypothetical protein RRG08_018159 [Elysia crispata]|uniref:JNK1/MAPK8-associated membrane protein n=1 Tax=Elysia crispata TaxID=231223 RepID=A0AAE1AY46_9GAST|nr:hypothetical protein RRG08_018159 [Elysia crispata]